MFSGPLQRLGLASVSLLIVAGSLPAAEPGRPVERETAAKVDALFQKLPAAKVVLSQPDEAFVRRAYLDLTGKLPTPEEVRGYVAERSADKRAQLIDRLLRTEAYAVNWGRYWRDVVTYHTPASGNYLRWQLFDRWWTDQLKRNRPWDEVVAALVTATGQNDEQAPVNYLTAMYGNPIEIAAVTSRVFLGVQIQCAECHNAKTEPWKREQFHEFAAFFGRAKIIQHKDTDEKGRGTPYAIEGRAAGQYRMTDKKDPDRLLDMQPRFLSGETVAIDAPDEVRRAALARFMTSPSNPWFARAYVNHMWTSLMGWGFYPNVADLGGFDDPQHKEVLDLLAKDWVASGHDPQWLFRTIMLTRAYQSQLANPKSSTDGKHAPCVCPTRLRPEQVFEALQRALSFDEKDTTIPAPAPTSAPAVQRFTGLRNMVYQAFKENPSLPFSEVSGTIPQALLMMNSVLVNTHTSAKGKTVLAQLLAEGRTDEQIVAALYERVLARKPTAEEVVICKRFVDKVQNREEALEDVLWSLINSTEFLIKK